VGLAFDTCDLTDPSSVREAVPAETRFVWVETPSNPTLKIVDIAAVSSVAHAAGAKVVVDNTFATPAAQRPLALGADVVVHSVTKYIGGHSDLIGGALVTSDAELEEPLGFLVNAVGAVPGPMDSYLALRGLKTLAMRMERHASSAGAIAAFLDRIRRSTRCTIRARIAPRPRRRRAADVELRRHRLLHRGSAEEAVAIAERTELFFLAESLGGVESLIEVPGPMTHASVAGSPIEVAPELIRLSVGVEHPDDLIEDLRRALG
jgi:cystathionine gamma-synthase